MVMRHDTGVPYHVIILVALVFLLFSQEILKLVFLLQLIH